MSPKGTTPNPGPTAVYRLFSADGQLLYVGISDQPHIRLTRHAKTKSWWKNVVESSTTLTWYGSRPEASTIEAEAILNERPLHNVAHNRHKPVKMTPVLLALQVATGEYNRTKAALAGAAAVARAAILQELQAGRTVPQVAAQAPFTYEYVRRIAAEHDIPRDERKARYPKKD